MGTKIVLIRIKLGSQVGRALDVPDMHCCQS